MKAMSLRLPTDLADDLEIVAAVDETTISDVVREAIARYIEKRRSDESFRRALQDRIDRESLLLAREAPSSEASIKIPREGSHE